MISKRTHMKISTLFVLLLVIGACTSVQAKSLAQPECGEVAQPVKWTYCIHRTDRSKDSDVVYLLHGHEQDEKIWNVEPDFVGIQTEWAKSDVPEPTVITVSFGPIWLLVPRNASPNSGLLDVYAKF